MRIRSFQIQGIERLETIKTALATYKTIKNYIYIDTPAGYMLACQLSTAVADTSIAKWFDVPLERLEVLHGVGGFKTAVIRIIDYSYDYTANFTVIKPSPREPKPKKKPKITLEEVNGLTARRTRLGFKATEDKEKITHVVMSVVDWDRMTDELRKLREYYDNN